MIHEKVNLSIKNPIISNHSVYGQELLPGLAYVDMIFQFFHKHHQSCNEFELRNVSIYNPLIIRKDHDVMLTLQYSEIREGQWQIVVDGQEQSMDGNLASDKRYVTAEMHHIGPVIFDETLEFNQIKHAAKNVISLDEIYDQCRLQDLIHNGFMKAIGKIYEGETATFIDIQLGQEASSGAEDFLFHPVLIDGSAIGSGSLLSSLITEEQRLFLPLFLESFRASEFIQQRCIARIQTSSLRRKKELLYLTIEFFNESGRKVAELRNFVSKLVRGAELINPKLKSTVQSEASSLAQPLLTSFPEPNYAVTSPKSVTTIEVETFLQQLMADRLNKTVKQIETQVGYYEMGLDSPGLLEIVQGIGTKIGAALSPTLLFEYTTIAELAAYLTENYASKFGTDSATLREIEQEVPEDEVYLAPSVAQSDARIPNPDIEDGGSLSAISQAVQNEKMPVVPEDIAIIGMGGRYPKAVNLQEFWVNLTKATDCISEIPKSRWDWNLYEGLKSPSGKSISKWGGFIDDPDYFDPQFFRVSPREAELMDPQERLFLETCWETMEDAGYTPKTVVTPQGPNKRRQVGVFVGVMHKDYTLIGAEAAFRGEAIPLSLNNAPIANRVSYFCNFHGPSMAIDTVCSSSLTAVHLALESIRHGECEVALAGGVNLSLNPNKYLTYGMMDMHASDGYCHTFGKAGDGYVSGEGVGAVLLKPLRKAVQDGDHIYAVIKGSTINHVGTVSGITVPSPVAQADMIASCIEKTSIDPRTISYVEAHGTGTSLGDPIEIEGLVKAFRLYTQDQQYCSIGSVKSNIGHAEAAAGISALTKVALQLHYKTLVPSLHSEELNPYIDFEQSPFFVQHNTEEWQQPVLVKDGKQVSYPRRAGLNSFGATGSNVHMILEEYIPRQMQDAASISKKDSLAVIPLSAKNKERLQAYAKTLAEFLKRRNADKSLPSETETDLLKLAYTLQVGRESMEERVVFLVKDISQLIEKLEAYGEGKEEINDCWQGYIKHSKETVDLLSDQESLELIHKWTVHGKVRKLAELWVKGLGIDWNLCYGASKPRRMSLPTYPFAKERYWVPENKSGSGIGSIAANLGGAAVIHPLLHQNTSNFSEQRFSSTFTGQEFFLADHVVQGQKVLPGVAYLEMAREAVAQAAGVAAKSHTGIQLKNIVWARPIVVGEEPVVVHIGLFPEDSGEIAYEIYSESKEDSTEFVVHSQGNAVLRSVADTTVLDLITLQAQCRQSTLTPSQCYEVFKAMGIEYGPAHKGIEMVYVGSGQVLAKLSLPFSASDTQEQFVLHPSVMDSALQASIGLIMSFGDVMPDTAASLKPPLPFALQQIETLGKCTSSMWALIRYSDGCKAEDNVQKLDIELFDAQGNVCVRMKGLSSRVLGGEVSSARSAATLETVLLHHYWEEQGVIQDASVSDYMQHVVMFCEAADISLRRIQTQINGVRCLTLQSAQDGIEGRFQDYAAQVFEEIQNILIAKPAGKVLVQIVVPNQEEQQLLAGLSGLLKTAQLENPKLIGQLIEIEPGEESEGIIKKLKENSRSPIDNYVRYRNGKRLLAVLGEIEAAQEAVSVPWKNQGIYLITGGAGGLGFIFAREIACKVKDAILVLTGRSPLDGKKHAKLKELQRLGILIEYRQVDVTQKKAVDDLIQSIEADFGGINGIIHSAGVIKDNFIIKKTKEELQAVLAPKVAGLVYLDQASKELPLDFFILFSSGAGVVGNPGQADYAAANAFMDSYAVYRRELVASNQRHGQTLSINWPLWQEGGMHVDVQTETMMRQNTGMAAMQTASGIRALYQSLASGKDQVMVMEGERKKLRAGLLAQQTGAALLKTPDAIEKSKTAAVIDQDSLPAKAANYFKKLLSSVLKLPAHRIEADAPLEQYGIDSVMVMQLTNQLEKTFGSLPKTLFFEYQNIQELASYFLENYRVQLAELWGSENKTAAPSEILPDVAAGREFEKSALRSQRRSRFAPLRRETREEKEALDIAIIGVSGRYPQAGNIQEFWKNLREGKNCITEIPKDRWDYNLYFDEDKNKPGKTYSKWGGFLSGVDQFDPLFFNISPREAQIMDPQERLFLECVYETLEDAGYTKEALGLQQSFGLGGNVGVYVGVMYEEYQLYGAQEQIQGRPFAVPGNPSSIANRISYFFNFHGPSMAVDTMCSSSLTSIHLACQSLQRGGCEVAIAGGVNVSIHPNKYLLLSQGKFASSKGRCESFGQGGEGYVPGEGVGALLLKPLAKAAADGDHIYGVIKGTAINHGGKTNGYTVPNPNAQASVMERAFQEAGIDPRTISYIEAHGTGTSLGDPIEIAGLTKAFQAYTKDKQFCAIGSAKSNIGHCESAAGIAGVTKVLLQLKYHQLVPSLHSRVLNPNIDFSNTPFIVQQEAREWKCPVVESQGETKEYPRIAGISAFGAGGANAHIVIEEYVSRNDEQSRIAVSLQNPAIIILSAKNEGCLCKQVERLIAAIQGGEFSDTDLADIAYTLQVGREAMEERLAVFVRSLKELEEKLMSYVAGQDDIENLYRGQVKRNKEMLDVFSADEDMSKITHAWITKGKYGKILDLWVKGLVFDWNQLYGDTKPHRISLPTYPFAKERYWIPEEGTRFRGSSTLATPAITAAIHPLLHRNTSDLWEQRFSSTFTGQEVFCENHIVDDQRILPGVVCLEMARAAVKQAAGGLTESRIIHLKNVVWAQSIAIVDQEIEVHIGLYPEDNGEVAYEIYSDPKEGNTEPVVYSQGRATLSMTAERPSVNLKTLQSQCTQGSFTAAQYYETLRSAGSEIDQKPQGIEKVYVGSQHVLAKLSLSSFERQNQFVLSPSLMEVALQASIGLTNKSIMPAALEELEFLGRCTPVMWALIRYSDGSRAGDKIERFDMDLCDEQGRICIRMKSLSSRVLDEKIGASASLGVLMLQPAWQEEDAARNVPAPDYAQHIAIFCEVSAVAGHMKKKINGVRCITLQSEREGIEERFQDYVIRVFEEIQGILKGKTTGKVLIQVITSLQDEHQLFVGLGGLLKTAQLENPKLIGQLIEIEPEEVWEEIIEKLAENSRHPMDKHIRYQDKRCVADWSEVKVSQEVQKIPWKDQGIYLITGGVGGLGQLFARDIVDTVKNATLILTGRSALSAVKQAELKKWEALGTRIEYQQMDVTQKAAVDSLLQYIQEHYGSLQGIIHSAGVIKDNFIFKKTKEELQAVMKPKVAGLVYLDQASKGLPLDFFILFSSIAGRLGNVGQADYAAANAFMDAYAKYRNTLVTSKERFGQTLSINWPLWQEGGMRIDAETERIMRQSMGMVAMQTTTGIQALYQALASGKEQVMVAEGDLSRMQTYLLGRSSPVPAYSAEAAPPAVEPWLLREKTLHQLKVILGEITKLSVDRIDAEEPLESYGIDSIMITQLNQKLDGIFGELSKTLFYEYQTLNALTEYLTADYPQQCLKWTGIQEQVALPREKSTASSISKFPVPISLKTRRKLTRGLVQTFYPSVNEQIAIIGMSGRYPQAKTLQDYWENLKTGRDCITEIPQERWSLDGFYHSNSQEAVSEGKSYSKWGGFVEGFADFDPLFFNISPREANDIDPQERLFVEACWNVLEDGGYTKERLETQYNRRVGVFAGITKTGFELYSPDLWKQGEKFHLRTSFGSVANRISYLLNLQGPSMPIDTMCSSSLTAIHEACEHIYRGECEIAIAGGVNLYLHPSSYIGLCGQRMLSVDGKCKSFGLGGNGFVPGEGVGVVLLKRLSQALSDEDHIYAVIRGTSINHGGKTNGYTVPNPIAQGDLIRMALDKAGVDARTVSYIEAHGTGTELGDPIEITGLSQAFQKDTQDTGFCAIGSVKSNIGHLEAAAGIAGVAKIILQMNNKEIVPSLHAEELNPNINFCKTPFVVQRELTEWKRPMVMKGGETKEYPRIAGISSFGAGGSNAHVVLEEYIPKKQERSTAAITLQNPALILLSAKSEEGLQARAQQLLSAIEQQQFTDHELADVAYTLQVGREAMEERLAVLAGSVKELSEKLQGFIEGQNGMKDLYRGHVKRHKDTFAALGADEEMLETMEKWMQRRKYGKVLELWVKGLAVDWNKLYGDSKPRRISLPTYPFARERYWLPEIQEQSGGRRDRDSDRHAVIHPLLQENTSDFSEQRFTSTFTGQEFFLADHVVKGQRVLPGVVYLEMARAAVEQAAGVLADDQTVMQLKNVVWIRPLAVGDQPVKVHIGLFPEEDGEIAFEIYSEPQEAGAEPVIHSQGIAVLSSASGGQVLDLPTLRKQCSQSILVPSQCYEAFKSMDLQYGPRHQGLEMVYVGTGQVVAKLSLPSAVFDTRGQFVLHPSLLDSALQAAISLMRETGDRTALKPFLPVALNELEVLEKCTSDMWVRVRSSDGSQGEDKVQEFDIDLCNEQGNICVRMKGLKMQENIENLLLTSLEIKQPIPLVSSTQEEPFELMTFEEIWQEQTSLNSSSVEIKTLVCFLSNPENQQAIAKAVGKLDPKTKVIFVSQNTDDQEQPQQKYRVLKDKRNTYDQALRSIREDHGEVDAVLYLWALEDPGCIQDYSIIVYLLQAIASTKLKPRRLLLTGEFENALERCCLESWIGFERSLGLVLPSTQVNLICKKAYEQRQEFSMEDWLQKIWAELQTHKAQSILYLEGKRHVCQIRPTFLSAGKSLVRSEGTYLITGGCGGLGFLFAQHIAKMQPVNLILVGRSAIDQEKQSKMKALEELGSQVLYIEADICDEPCIKEGLDRAREHFGRIHGVIHAAGMEDSQSILEKEIQSFTKVLEAKIKGTLVLDQLLQEDPLDFICYFSSTSAVLGDFGSCDYAIGNRFLMAYAHSRNHPQRQGKAIVINWPLWKDGGMGFKDDETSRMYLKSSGQRFLELKEGMDVFDRILSQDNTQNLVFIGQRSRVHRFLGVDKEQSTPLHPGISGLLGKGRRVEMKGFSLEECLEWDLKEHVSKLLKISRDKIDIEENLAEFGFDSISLAEFAALLANHYGIELTPALFFQYSTLQKITQYFMVNHQEAIQEFYREDAIHQTVSRRIPSAAVPSRRETRKSRFKITNTLQSVPEPIAIIGMSGRFPNARNSDEMWDILAQGQDAVKEISPERFPVRGPKWKCGWLPGVSEFDPLFFEISPKEAKTMDPKQRLLLQESWNALEDAGYGAAKIKASKIGMFVGVEDGDYRLLVREKGNVTSNHNGILAARLSYFLNLKGPNIAINTACSSGLVAAHQACWSLRNHECDTAIAAGVSLMLLPEMFEILNQAGMLSEDGRCFAFDKRANGMVPGEAVAAVVCKRLSQAKADGDQIYAVIKGSAINYDGKTNGITAPSGSSQTELLQAVYEQYQVNPEEIEYIVTHGTGTKLGDPIEINALYDAFKQHTKKQGYCALTSPKTNFGHTFAASGLVSLISLVQSLRHETIPASLHCEQENDYINWKESPFYVNKANRPWPQVGTKKRTGAVSAFGMSGTNAHMVVESYAKEEAEGSYEEAPFFLLALSAKTPEALQEKIKNMITVFTNKDLKTKDLLQISYTLLEGRQHFNHRSAIVIQDCEDAVYVWQQAGGKERLPNLFQGKVSRDFKGQKPMQEYAGDLLTRGQLLKENKTKYQEILYALADLYCQGYDLSWNLLFDEKKPCRLSLPTYPFAKESYWVPQIQTQGDSFAINAVRTASIIHPLLQQNTSDFSEQRFSSTFTGQEFFLADHVVKGQRILPGMAYLEMARAAVEQAVGSLAEEQTAIRLKNVTWVRPIAVGEQPFRVHIGLFPEDSGEIAFEIYSKSSDSDEESMVHSHGFAAFQSASEVPLLDLSALQALCNQSRFSSDQCYEAFRAMGLDYGPAYQGIEQLYVGVDQVLAKLSLPASVSDTQEQFVLHPSLMDASSQAAIGFMMGTGDSKLHGKAAAYKTALPFALEELEVLGKCTPCMWALVRSDDFMQGGEIVQKLNIDLCDEQGNICVRMKGFLLRVMEDDLQRGSTAKAVPDQNAEKAAAGTLMLTPVWDTVLVEKGAISPLPTEQVVIVGGTKGNRKTLRRQYPKAHVLDIHPNDTIDAIVGKLSAHGPIDHILWIAPHDSLKTLAENTIIEEQKQGVILAFRMIKALLHLGYDTKNLGWSIITTQVQPIHKDDSVNPTHASLHGIIGSMAKEYPNWQVRLIDLEADCNWPINELFTLPSDLAGNAWAYRGQEWYRQKLISFHYPSLKQTLYKSGGVYVVIGGSGGIGEVWSEYMIRTYQAHIIWIGRRQKDGAIQAKLDRLANLGPSPCYIKADARDQKELQQAYEEIKQRYSQVHGVIHSAIVLLDQSLAKMDEEKFQAGLSAKIDVSVRMAQVFQKEPLDFVMFFSALNSFIKAPGQSNYAAGCTFKDAFAHQLSHEWPCKVKVMNWGYWGSIGIVASKEYQERMAKAGIGSIEPPDAMDALETLLAGPKDQVALMKITKPLVMEGINTEESIEFYPEDLLSNVENLQNRIPEQDSQLRLVKAEASRYMKEMDELLCRLLWGQLQSIGLFTEKNSVTSDIKTMAGLSDMYGRWLGESIRVLEQNNYLQCDEGTYFVIDASPIDIDAVWGEWDQKKAAWIEDSFKKAQVSLVEATLRALPKILTGQIRTTDIIFPNASMELVEGVYKNNIVADYFNEVLADTVVAYIEERLKQDPSVRIRILEIGAGTGGTSFMVFKKVKPYQEHIQEYCYSDISKAFLMHAKKAYGPYNPYLTYKLFNVAESINGQDISAGGYDIVIATNVLHATKNIRQTLRNAKAAIKKNGLILLNEISGNALVTHLTFGLLEGWWLYEDSMLRIPGCPGLSSESWKRVLKSEGFRTTFFPVPQAHELGQQIIVAESDGAVLQKLERKADVTPMTMKQSLKMKVLQEQVPTFKPSIKQTEKITQDLLREKGAAYIKKVVGETLQIASSKIDSSDPLEKYGIDSLIVVQLANNLGKVFDGISSTLFFEYPTIDALVEYFISNHKDSLLSLAGLEDHEAIPSISNDPNDDEIILEKLPVHSKLACRKSKRFPHFRDQENKRAESQTSLTQDIAIIGVSGRYPGAGNIQDFWRNLQAGDDCITEIPKDRWDHSLYFDEDKNKPGKTYCKWGGFLEDVDQFDPLFFNISPREAEIMDPMSRLFLETVWNLLESPGYTRETLQREYQSKVGVYVGAMYQQYHSIPSDIVREAAISTSSYSSIANRVSHYFNLQGPSIAIDTMCSSSAIAIHMACESLIKGDCQLAIAGGVNLSIHPKKYLGLSLTGMLGSHSNSRSFGDGDGFLPAEGVGAILLKPLSAALRDRDSILAVVKSTAINHGGHSNGYTVPNPNAQARLIEENFIKAKIDPRTISYVESAATGSPLGDSIEVSALKKAFQKFTADQQFCAIGSVKSNIGHAEAASGISQLTKVVLQLQHKKLVPSIKTDPLNPNIHFENTPFYLQRELQEWKRPVVKIDGEEREYPRRATVSSFGAGGSNAHLIVEEYISAQDEKALVRTAASSQIVVFSAKNQDRLQAVLQQMLTFIELQQDLLLPAFAYTLQVGREAMECRLAMVVNTREELIQGLKESLNLFTEGKEAESFTPIYTGNLEDDLSNLKKLLSGKLGESMVQILLEEENLEKMALYWTQGGKIPWESLHEGQEVHRISLPTYPFEKRRCWVESQPDSRIMAASTKGLEYGAVGELHTSLEDQILDIISRSLGIKAEELNPNKPLDKYGVDSIVFMSIFQQLQLQVDSSITLNRLLESKTTQDVINMVCSENVVKAIPSAQYANLSIPITWPQFPELIHLNQNSQGRPVFWFHGGLGGVEIYQEIAQKIERPFYGIQARGWMNERSPLHGIHAMAAYYIHIIQTVQPEGPYDLGGYSLGGTLAYEITRQLQELGQRVNTIVMLDSIYCPEIKKSFSQKSMILQIVNIALLSTIGQEAAKASQTLIHQEEVPMDLEDETFLDHVIQLAQTRGLTKPVTQLLAQIQQSVKVQQAYKFGDYSVGPLPDPHGVTCYYFRNKSGLFWGELAPYFTSKSDDISLDHATYWEEWERQLPKLTMMDVDSPNHMMLLADKPFEIIAAFCEKLYS
jgi:polyketide synthase PksN